jgi:hypothetical protein
MFLGFLGHLPYTKSANIVAAAVTDQDVIEV